MRFLLVVLIALTLTTTASAHLVKSLNGHASRAVQHQHALRDYRHALYVCVKGWGRPKRVHCRALPWLRRYLAGTRPVPPVDIGPWMETHVCESRSSWYTDTGNGYYGGLQFDHGTWIEFGGGRYAYNANGASPQEQVIVASRVNYDAWPNCPNP